MLQSYLFLFSCFEFLLETKLVPSFLLELTLGLHQVLLLLHRLLHGLCSVQQLLLHVLDLLQQFLLLLLLLGLVVLLLLQCLQQLPLLFFLDFHLLLYLDPLLLELLLRVHHLFFQLLLHLLHLLSVVHVHDLLHFHLDLSIRAHLASIQVQLPPGELVKLSLEPHDLLLELPDHGVLGVLVDPGFVLNQLCSAGIPQRTQSFFDVVVSRTDVGNHDRLGVSSKGVLEQSRELGVSEGNVVALRVCQ